MKNVLLTLIAVAASIFLIPHAQAQEYSGQVEPAFQHIFSKSNRSIYLDLTYANVADPQVTTFHIYRISGHDLYGNVNLELNATSPIRIFPIQNGVPVTDPALLLSKERQEFTIKVDIPPGTPEGEYAYALVLRAQPQPAPEGAITAQISSGVGSILLVSVVEDLVEEPSATITELSLGNPLSISLFGAELNLFQSNAPVPISLVVENNGESSVIPRGQIRLKQHFGKEHSYPLTPTYVFPNKQRLLSSLLYDRELCLNSYTSQFCQKAYTAVLDGYSIGVYEVIATVDFDTDGPTSHQRKIFIVLPYRIIAGILFLLFIIGFALVKEWQKHLQA